MRKNFNNKRLANRFAASSAATTKAVLTAPFNAVQNCVGGVGLTVYETIAAPINSIQNGRIVEAPFDMVAALVKGVGETIADTVASVTIDPVEQGCRDYLEFAGEDANPKTEEFVKKYFVTKN